MGIRGFPEPNIELRKVGRTTGLTIGQRVDECVDIEVQWRALHYGLICQDLAAYHAAGGDSGAPVFWADTVDDQFIGLMGIHHGTQGGLGVYSPWINISVEILEPGEPIFICAPEFGC